VLALVQNGDRAVPGLELVALDIVAVVADLGNRFLAIVMLRGGVGAAVRNCRLSGDDGEGSERWDCESDSNSEAIYQELHG